MSNQIHHPGRRKCLLPGELEQMKREELSQKRRLRLLQVREQGKEVASSIRESVKKEKAEQLEKLKNDVLREKHEEKENALQNLKQQYYENVCEIGSAWRAAQNQASVQEELKVRTHLNNIAASERGQQALEEYWKENALKKESSNSALQARKFALAVEKERAAYIASLPPPKPDPVEALLESSGKVKAVHDQKIMRPDINVEKANPEEEPDACEAAQMETNKQQQMESEKAKLQEKRGIQMKNRFKEAWKKKILHEEYSKTLKDIEDEERLARNEARQNYYSDENRYFMCSPLDKQIRKDKQARAEDAFQKHFRAERDYEDNNPGEYSFREIEKTEENAEITDYVEPPLRIPCASLLESDFEEVDSRDDLDELNIAYIESPEQKEAPKKRSEFEALSTLLVKLRKRRAELHDEGEQIVKLCLGVISPEAGKPEAEILPPKSVAVQAGKVFPPISTGIQTVLEETDIQGRLPSTSRKVQTDAEQMDVQVETGVQADVDLEQHAIESVTTAATKESTSTTSYMSLPPQYGIPQFLRAAQTKCDICDVERSQALHASERHPEPLLVKPDAVVQPDVSRVTSPFQETMQEKITETGIPQDIAIKGMFEFYHPEISPESLASYMKHMTKYDSPDSDEKGSETEVKTVFQPLDFSSAVKYVEPFSVVSPGKLISLADSEIGKVATVITSPSDDLQLSDSRIKKPTVSQMEHDQHDVSDQVFIDGDESSAPNLGILSATSENIYKGTVTSDDEIYNQLEVTQKLLMSQFLDSPSADIDEASAKQLQDYLLNLNIFKSRPPVTIHRVVPGEVMMGHELSTIQEIDSVANGSSTDRVPNLSRSDVMSSSGTFQPLTPVSHQDSPVVDHSKHSGELPELESFPETFSALSYDTESRSRKGERQLPYSVSGSTESFQPMSLDSYQASTDGTKSDTISFVPSSSESFPVPTATEAENGHVASHIPATSDVASLHPVETVICKSEMVQTSEKTKKVIASKISHDSSTASFHPLSTDHDSSLRTAQISYERDDREVSEFLHTQKLENFQQVESTGSPPRPVIPSESLSRHEHSSALDIKGIKYGETSSGSYQLMSVQTDSSVVIEALHSHSKQILYADTSSGSFQPMSATAEDSQLSSSTIPKIVVSDYSAPAVSITLEGNEQDHFGSSLQSYLASTKIQHSCILTSTNKDSSETLPSTTESLIIHRPSVPPLFHKASISDSGGSFCPMTSHLESTSSSFTAENIRRTECTQVAETKYYPAVTQTVSLPSSPQKIANMGKLPTAHDQYRYFHQGSQPFNLAKMVLKRNTSSSSGSFSSSQESLISVFTESKIIHQSTPVKAREVAIQDAGILEEPDLTLIGSEISCSLNTTPRKLPEKADDTLIDESTSLSSSFQSGAQEVPCPSVESVEQKRDPDSASEAGHISSVRSNMTTPVSDYSVLISPVSASLLSFEKHEIEFAGSDHVSPSVLPHSSNLEFYKELPNRSPSMLCHRAESNFSQATSSEPSTPTTGTPKMFQKSSTDYKSRTRRLWNNLAEVKEKKLAEEKKQAFVKNREKVKELQMKIQKARKIATPKK